MLIKIPLDHGNFVCHRNVADTGANSVCVRSFYPSEILRDLYSFLSEIERVAAGVPIFLDVDSCRIQPLDEVCFGNSCIFVDATVDFHLF
jgi:hypothetical protein